MTAKVFVRAEYNYDMAAASQACGLRCDDESLTKQSFAEEADINTIVRRFHLSGELPQNVVAPVYQDFEGVFDYHSAMNVVRSASESFAAMPASVRSRFGNDAESFVQFCSDVKNRAEAEKLGLVFKAKVVDNNSGAVELQKGGKDGVQQDRGSDVGKVAGVDDRRVDAESGSGSAASGKGAGRGRSGRSAEVESKSAG